MAIKVDIIPHTLKFHFDARTSRGSLKTKETFFIKLYDDSTPYIYGVGECSPLSGLSPEYGSSYLPYLKSACTQWENSNNPSYYKIIEQLSSYPSIQFGFEMAYMDFVGKGKRAFFVTGFEKGESRIPINGLIWMGSRQFMFDQIKKKLNEGFECIKIKVGGIDFEEECGLLAYIRNEFSAEEITLRVDANGAFSPKNAIEKLKRLSEFELHSIEQPIKQGQLERMASLCELSPIPIALDEELIGVKDKKNLLETIKPPFIILKPSLLGGFLATQEWIRTAEEMNIGWWITSALESNIGLNAICQLTSAYPVEMPQGLGTGMLYSNNINSPLTVNSGEIYWDIHGNWDNSFFKAEV
ncbi:o-succinylbenzoate synthase [Flammeovirgaceae bacterium SG7u.111]|nr:o-succinylbenzoate synthase [Flammeovirgaceae bacterium SG7u.132]WPO38441.1 o-succinylbenzoate synthase [Flammeovirgaceae bacterium SG7u.111]